MANNQAQPETILLLDDDPHFRQIVVRLLVAAGYKVVEAQSAMVATAAILADNKPVAAIVDYRLPGMNGVDWIEQMRAYAVDIPMMLSTALELDKNTVKTLNQKFNVHVIVSKPIDPATFLQQVHTLLPSTTALASDANKQANAGAADQSKKGDLRSQAAELEDPIEHFIRDELEAELKKARTDYLRDTLLEVDSYLAALSIVGGSVGASGARELAHKILGTSGSFGLAAISNRARVLEELITEPSQTGNHAALANGTIARLLSELRSEVILALDEREVLHKMGES
jgi:DNA-binding response OmpR family regulator